MARLESTIARALAAYLALWPLLGIPAQATDRRPSEALPPSDPQPPGGPQPPGPSLFTAIDESVTVKSLNGFSSEAVPGYFSHHGHSHDGGLVRVDSPWGEQLRIRYWLTPHGVSFEYDDDLKVRYRFAADGTLVEIVAESPLRQARMPVGNRGQLAKRGELDFTSFDLSAYQVIEEAMRAKHSEAFLDGLRQTQGALAASCSSQIILCAACIIAWANSVPAIAAACIVGGTITFGGACFLAILAHEAAGFACAVTCADAVRECRGRPQGDVFPDGCDP